MQHQHHASSSNNTPSYAVYSFQHKEAEKKGSNWRNHGHCEQKDEALWIAEQLTRCDDVARVEIRLQGLDAKTNTYKDRCIKYIDKQKPRISLFNKMITLFKKS